MSHANPVEQVHLGSARLLPFPPAEVEEMHADDKKAATAIVLLMAGIFILGVIGYLGICFWVAA